MPLETLLDYLPLWALFLFTMLLVTGSISLGYLLGDRRRREADGAEKGKPGTVGTTLGLLAFLLAFNFSLAANRYEQRNALLQETATAIRSAYLYAERLPAEQTAEYRGLLASYVDARLNVDVAGYEEWMAGMDGVLDRAWAEAGRIAAEHPSDPNSRLLLTIANQVEQNHRKAVWANLYNRIPAVTWTVLYLVTMLGMLALGYEAGLSSARYRMVTALLALCFSTVLLLVAALDRPANALLQVDQTAMQDLGTFMERRAGG